MKNSWGADSCDLLRKELWTLEMSLLSRNWRLRNGRWFVYRYQELELEMFQSFLMFPSLAVFFERDFRRIPLVGLLPFEIAVFPWISHQKISLRQHGLSASIGTMTPLKHFDFQLQRYVKGSNSDLQKEVDRYLRDTKKSLVPSLGVKNSWLVVQ
jgi:hypothetical protein